MHDETECRSRILSGRYEFREDPWNDISFSAKDFVRRLLLVQAGERMSPSECLAHSWLTQRVPELNGKHCLQRKHYILSAMRTYASSSHLKRAALSMMARHLPSSQLQDIADHFLSLDADRSGTISCRSFQDFFFALGVS